MWIPLRSICRVVPGLSQIISAIEWSNQGWPFIYVTKTEGWKKWSVFFMSSLCNWLTFQAHADGSPWRDPAARLHLRAWKSLSQRHLLIQDPGVKLSCNTTIPITFSYTNLKKHPNVLFNYQVRKTYYRHSRGFRNCRLILEVRNVQLRGFGGCCHQIQVVSNY